MLCLLAHELSRQKLMQIVYSDQSVRNEFFLKGQNEKRNRTLKSPMNDFIKPIRVDTIEFLYVTISAPLAPANLKKG